MSPQQVRDWYRSHGGKPIPALVQTALVLLLLHYFGLLLPLSRFFFLAVMLIGGAAALITCGQIAIRNRGRVAHPKRRVHQN